LGRVVVLAAGKSTRLGGACKLLLSAGGVPVHQWHSSAWGGDIDAVVLPEHVDQLAGSGWEGRTFGVGGAVGPARTLLEYMNAVREQGRVTVVYADSLLRSRIDSPGDWVGVSVAPGRQWDYWDGFSWVRGAPKFEVCCGIYQFEDGAVLLDVLSGIEYRDGAEIGMTAVLQRYDHKRRMERLQISDWQDAGDWHALEAVKK